MKAWKYWIVLTLKTNDMEEKSQLNLFEENENTQKKKRRNGGSRNPIVFNDYESFIRKFTENPKTTDECWTPKDVFEAVVQYVGEIYDLKDKVILRPFYPGGDYLNADYPENGVVIDNPPFSIFLKIVKFYSEAKIPFFLFGPGMTIANCCKWCTAVIVADQITFSNGAKIRCNFATNLMGDTLATTSIRLTELLRLCPSQNAKVNMPAYVYPDEVLSVADFHLLARGREDFSISRRDAVVIKNLDLHPKKGLFGDHFLAKEGIEAARKEAARIEAARKEAARKEAARRAIKIELSERERRIVENLRKGDRQ